MTTMTDEAAKKIAKSIAKKYENADHKMFIVLEYSDKLWGSGTMNDKEIVVAAINMIYKFAGDEAEAVLKEAAKQAKQLKKEEAKDAKRKKNA